MKNVIINSGKIPDIITPPPGKSTTLRAIFFAMLAKGKSVIHNYLDSPDTRAMLEAVQKCGSEVKVFPKKIEIHGNFNPPPSVTIDAKNSGIVLRFMAAIAGLSSSSFTITGDKSIKENRIIKPLIDGLFQLKAKAMYLEKENKPPVKIQGPIIPGKITIDGKDSQPVSALLIASAFAKKPSEIFVENPGELPWIQLTLDFFDFLNIKYENQNFRHYKLSGNTKLNDFEITIPSDFSSCSFPIATAFLTNSETTIKNFDLNAIGGDKKFIEIIKNLGGNIEINHNKKELTVKKNSLFVKNAEIDVNDIIDAIPILAVLACNLFETTTLYNGQIAKFKESNRIKTICLELKKMGANITETSDGLIIKKSKLQPATLQSHKDHRIAMALCIASLTTQKPCIIQDVECIKKSYPDFFNNLGFDYRWKI